MTQKETRIMKVTMDSEDFQKYDEGNIHSNHGIRNSKGQLSALPDIEPVTEEDLPEREVIKTETVYIEAERQETSIGTIVGEAISSIIVDIISDPEIQKGIAELGKTFWYHKVKPRIDKTIHWIKSDNKLQTKAPLPSSNNKSVSNTKYKVETNNEQCGKITISEEEAAKLIEATKEEARRLAAMIYLLSNISIKDTKTEDEYILEQAYIKQLLSDESKNTMKKLVENEMFLDKQTVMYFTDFLDGYIRNGEKKIAIPIDVPHNGA